jgi:hypothetical protein
MSLAVLVLDHRQPQARLLRPVHRVPRCFPLQDFDLPQFRQDRGECSDRLPIGARE